MSLNVTDITLNFGETIHLYGRIENLGNGTVNKKATIFRTISVILPFQVLWMKEDSKIIAVGNAVVIPDSRVSVIFDESSNRYDLTIQVCETTFYNDSVDMRF